MLPVATLGAAPKQRRAGLPPRCQPSPHLCKGGKDVLQLLPRDANPRVMHRHRYSIPRRRDEGIHPDVALQAGRQAGGQTARQGRGENRPGGWVGHAQHVPREGLQADTRLQRCGRLPSSSTPAAPAAHPQPVSPPDQTSLTLSVNLHALPMRLYSTCTMRLVSPTTCGPGQAGQQATWQTEGAR